MRAIQKQSRGSESLRKAHAHPPQTPEQAQTRWSSFKGKKDLKNSLLEEQYALCCYTEIRADQEQLGTTSSMWKIKHRILDAPLITAIWRPVPCRAKISPGSDMKHLVATPKASNQESA